jgi:large subunit ribosomal protein L3
VPPALFFVAKMIKMILGTKLGISRKYTQDGKDIPVTRVVAGPCPVVQVKTLDKDGYNAIQLGWGEKKLTKIGKPLKGHIKGAKLKMAPRFLREVRLDSETELKIGDLVKADDVFKPGDRIKVTGTSKGRGFTGVMKRWGFAGGPRTHGQSDRARAPGSIGQSADPGRVFPGKKMAGRSGGNQVTISNLTVIAVDEEKNELLIKGLVPGPRNSLLVIQKIGEEKKFIPLMVKGEKKIKESEEERKARLAKEKEAAEKLKEAEKAEETEKRPASAETSANQPADKGEKDAQS